MFPTWVIVERPFSVVNFTLLSGQLSCLGRLTADSNSTKQPLCFRCVFTVFSKRGAYGMLVQMSKTASTKYIARSESFRREPIAESNGVELPSRQMTCWAHGAELSIHPH